MRLYTLLASVFLTFATVSCGDDERVDSDLGVLADAGETDEDGGASPDDGGSECTPSGAECAGGPLACCSLECSFSLGDGGTTVGFCE